MYVGPVLIDTEDASLDVGSNYAYAGSIALTLSVNSPTVGQAPPTNSYAGAIALTLDPTSPTEGPTVPQNVYNGSIAMTIGVNGIAAADHAYNGSIDLTLGVQSLLTAVARSFDHTTAILNDQIADLVVEDDYDLVKSILSVPSGALLIEARFTVKLSESDADSAAIIRKIITTIGADGVGQILDDGASGTGSVLFQLTATETNQLVAGQIYCFDIQVLTNTGKASTRYKGWINPVGQVTQYP